MENGYLPRENRWRLMQGALLVFLLSLVSTLGASEPLISGDATETYRIACVGDSITFGAGTKHKGLFSYPAQLQEMLGERAVVKNFGVSGSTLLNSGDKPYQKEPAFTEALEFEPDIVVILLGTNDTKEYNWTKKDSFESDYLNLIEQFQALESEPVIVIGYPIIVVGEGKFNITQAGVEEQLPMIDRIAKTADVDVIDLHSSLKGHENLIPDTVHPNADGYRIMAETVFEKLTGENFVEEMDAVKVTEWRGFVRKDFDSAGRVGSLIFPEKAAPGNPWIWRTEFLGGYDTADMALVEKGWVLAYVAMPDLYGSPPAMEAMDHFYEKVIAEFDLDSKVVLEGFSRGGLYAFNWAARHPERVASIYGDAPVLDFKSWPGGLGAGYESTANWEKCKVAYGLTDAEVVTYPYNPVDNLKPLADAGIPILIVAGDSDRVVIVEENTLVVQERYKALGGQIKVILKPGVDHHPHSLEDPTPIVEFLTTHRSGN